MNRLVCRNSLTRIVGISRLLQRPLFPTTRFSSQKVPIDKQDVFFYRLQRRNDKFWDEQPLHKKLLIGGSYAIAFCGIVALILYEIEKDDDVSVKCKRKGDKDYCSSRRAYLNNNSKSYYLRIKKDLLFKHSRYYKENFKRNTTITVEEPNEEALELVMNYVCKDVLPADDANLEDMLYIAKSMKLENLEEHLRSLLLNKPVSMENIMRRLELAGKLEFKAMFDDDVVEIQRLKILWKTALPFFAEHHETIVNSEEWKELEERNSNAIWRAVMNLDEMYPGEFEKLKRECYKKMKKDSNEKCYEEMAVKIPFARTLLE